MNTTWKFPLRAGLLASVFGMAAGAAWAENTLTAVMHSDLRILDPIMTTAHITRNHGYMIYDVLVAEDADGVVQPQMADFSVSDDKLTWTFTLREGLKFHDGAPVTAADVVASLERWAARDGGGQMIKDRAESLVATDDRTVTLTLKEPFGPLLQVMGKQAAVPAFIMPARVAATPANQPIEEHIGSGPFRFVLDEFQPGVGATYVKFEDYIPRAEPASGYAGGKVVNVDKVRWVSMPDNQTALNALQAGDIDLVEQVKVDLLPLLDGDDTVVHEKRAALGYQTMGRMNFKYPPFDNVKIRQAALLALAQEPVLAAIKGNPDYYNTYLSVFGCGTPLESSYGPESLLSKPDVEGAKRLLAEAGYDGTKVLIMQPTDVASVSTQPVVAAQLLREAGFNVDLQAMDWQTLVGRRASMEPPEKGGWNMLFTNWASAEINSPLGNVMVNGRGDNGWFGWPVDEELEKLKGEFVAATDLAGQQAAAAKIQKQVIDNVIYVPLGEYVEPQARSVKVTDILPTQVPVFWNIKKAE